MQQSLDDFNRRKTSYSYESRQTCILILSFGTLGSVSDPQTSTSETRIGIKLAPFKFSLNLSKNRLF